MEPKEQEPEEQEVRKVQKTTALVAYTTADKKEFKAHPQPELVITQDRFVREPCTGGLLRVWKARVDLNQLRLLERERHPFPCH